MQFTSTETERNFSASQAYVERIFFLPTARFWTTKCGVQVSGDESYSKTESASAQRSWNVLSKHELKVTRLCKLNNSKKYWSEVVNCIKTE